LGDLQQSGVRGSGFFDKKIQTYSATLTDKLGSADIISISSYGITEVRSSLDDYTVLFGSLANLLFGVDGTPNVGHSETRKLTQELRLATPIGTKLDWLVGAFYTHEESQINFSLKAADSFTGAVSGVLFDGDIPTRFSEYAAFTDLTLHVTDRFDVQVGGRQSEIRQSYAETDSGPAAGGTIVDPKVHTKDQAFTYLLTPQFRVSPDLMMYARMASGYRAGGPNANSFFGLPPGFDPDKTHNYEIGVKGQVLDRALSFDASVYYISWKDIQLQLLLNGAFLYYDNFSRAKSEGVELSVESKPLPGLTLAGWVVWNTAELTEDFPAGSATRGVSGDRLPASSRFSGTLSLDQEFPVGAGMRAFIGGSVSYVGDRLGNFQALTRQDFPAYAQTNIRAGLRYEPWVANLFVTNVTDRRGVLSGGLDRLNPAVFNYIQPRTYGVSLLRTF
jgi:outer membrane receptor protein involved in Fe transport